MEEELKNLIKVCVSQIIAVSYCYYLSSRIKPGILRLVFVLPVCASFRVLPLFFSSVILCSYTVFFTSVANLKLILLCFDKGPLYPLPPNLFQFIVFTCFPVKLKQKSKSRYHYPKWFFVVKAALFVLVLHVLEYRQHFPPILLLSLYPPYLYLEHEMILTPLNTLVAIALGRELEPQFNEPYLATSLQDFWGRRWNIMVSDILRSGVFSPVRQICQRFLDLELAMILGVLATFVVSGVAHEVLFVYITREPPTWEVTLFFVLHGVCTVVEVLVKQKIFKGRFPAIPVVSQLLTMGVFWVTAGWLFFPQIERSNVMDRRAKEASLFVDFFKRTFW